MASIDEIKKQLEQPFAAHETWWHRQAAQLVDELAAQAARITTLEGAIRRVVWYDWSGNDTDATIDMNHLRSVLAESAPPTVGDWGGVHR